MMIARKLSVALAALLFVDCQAPTVQATAAHSWVEIDRKAFEANVRAVRERLGRNTLLCAVMKADAYGHGIRLLAPSVQALGVPYVGITANDEAQAVREGGFDRRILRLRTATPEEIEEGLRFDIEELTGSLEHARRLAELGRRRGRPLRLHLNLNSAGMSRNGLDLGTAQGKRDALDILNLPHLEVVGIMTHFPVEERNDVQRGLAVFRDESAWVILNARRDRDRIFLHCANSFATLEVPESHLDLVRPGSALYGDTPPRHSGFKRVMAFKSRVGSVNGYPAGRSVSYDRTFVLRRDSRLANIPVGYSDGYPRAFSNNMHVLIRGRRFPVLGRVTMNTIMVDVTDDPEVRAGDEVVLFGKQGAGEITQAEMEKSAGTIFADLCTAWGRSNPRILKPE